MRLTFAPSETGWVLNASSEIIPIDGTPTPPNALRSRWGIGSDPTARIVLSGLVPGESYDFWAVANFDEMPNDPVGLLFSYNDGNGLDVGLTRSNLGGSGWRRKKLGTLVYSTPNRLLRINGSTLPGTLGSTYVDSIYIGEEPPEPEVAELTKRREIRDAIVARIAGVAGVGECVVGTQTPQNFEVYPHVEVSNAQQTKELSTGTLTRKYCTANYRVRVFAKDTATERALDVADEILGEIERSVEQNDDGVGNRAPYLGLGYVFEINAQADTDDEDAAEDVAMGTGQSTTMISVTYKHNRREP